MRFEPFLGRERGGDDRVVERPAGLGQFQMVRAPVGFVRLPPSELPVGERLGGAVDRHLVPPGPGNQLALRLRRPRSEERRVWKECVSTFRYTRTPYI